MTQLREQFRSTRRAYRGCQYPGDLAEQLLPASPRRRRPWFLLSAFGGVAAAVTVIAVMTITDPFAPVATSDPEPDGRQVVQAPQPARWTSQWAGQLPDRVQLSVPAGPLMPATPPVSISLTALYDLGQPYDQIGPKLRQHLSWPGATTPPAAKPAEAAPGAATQQAV